MVGFGRIPSIKRIVHRGMRSPLPLQKPKQPSGGFGQETQRRLGHGDVRINNNKRSKNEKMKCYSLESKLDYPTHTAIPV